MSSEKCAAYEEEDLLDLLSQEDLCAEFSDDWDYGVPSEWGDVDLVNVDREARRPPPAKVAPAPASAAAVLPSGAIAPPPNKRKRKEPTAAAPLPAAALPAAVGAGGAAAAPPPKPKREVPCGICGRKFLNKERVEKHMPVHRMEEALAKNLPSHDDVMEKSREFASSVMQQMSKEYKGANGAELQLCSMAEQFLHNQENFVSFIDECTRNICQCMPSGRHSPRSAGRDIPLPSQMHAIFLSGLNRFMNSDEFYVIVENLKFEGVEECRIKVIFCTDFSRKLLVKVVAYAAKTLKLGVVGDRRAPASIVRTPAAVLYLKQCVHYVSGSVIRRILRPLFHLSGNDEKWLIVIEGIKLQFLKNDETGPHADLEQWTKAQDRGSLLYVTEKALCFFMYVAHLAKAEEQCDGSLDIKVVIAKIYDDREGVFKWDEVCGERFKGAQAHFLMDLSVQLFCSTWAKGIQKRRMNALHSKKGFIAQSHRGKLAGASTVSKKK